MRPTTLLILLGLLPCSPLVAQALVETPATQPAVAAASRWVAAVHPVQLAGQGVPAWIGRSVQRSLQAEVSAAGYVLSDRPAPADAAPVGQADSGLAIDTTCRGAGSTLSIQVDVRDAATLAPVGRISLSGNYQDFLTLKDQLRGQLHHLLDQYRQDVLAGTSLSPRLSTQELIDRLPPGLRPQKPASGTERSVMQPQTPPAAEPGSTFEDSSLSRAVDDPGQFEQQYRSMYEAQPFRGTNRRFYPVIPRYGYYPVYISPYYVVPGTVVSGYSTQQSQSVGLQFDFGYRGDNWNINVHGGAGQTSSSGWTGTSTGGR